jgi:WD40 repeat protein/serine/threonine protein kinase
MTAEPSRLAEREELLEEIVADFLERLQAGQSEDHKALVDRHPEFAAELEEFFRMRDRVNVVASPLRQAVLNGPPEVTLGDVSQLGDFRIIREVGRGGMGVVYEAHQLSLGRRVALKVLPFAATMDPRQLQRFHNEARAAAGLHHEHIVPVYAVGVDRGVHYYAMQFIDGQTLAEWIRQRQAAPPPARQGKPGAETAAAAIATTERTPHDAVYFRRAADWSAQAAEALEHAHQLGIVHRDVKPGNLMIDGQGKVWVTDFGLARTGTDAGLTLTGDLLGTLRYMSPEQALARHAVVDQRSDVYSLGATLYELLTSEPAFPGTDRQELLRQIAFEEPRPPRRLNPSLPVELETIVLKAMAKDPAERYGTAHELADDLRRFLRDEPIRARRPSLVQRCRKWTRRHRFLVWWAAVAAGVTVVALAVSVAVLARGLVFMAQARTRAEEQAATLRRQLYPTEMRQAYQHFLHGEVESLNALLARYQPGPDEEDLRGFEWYYLRGLAQALPRQRLCYRGHTGQLMCAVFAPDGREVASGDENGEIHLWSPVSGTCRAVLHGHVEDVNGLDFSPDGRTLASAGEDGTVRLWDVATGREWAVLWEICDDVEGVCFSRDGRSLVAPGANGRICLWDVPTRRLKLCIEEAHSNRIYTAVLSPDGLRIATASMDHRLKVWDSGTGQCVREQFLNGVVWDVAYAPDGSRLFTVDASKAVREWDAAEGKALGIVCEVPGLPRAVALSPDSRRIAVGADDGVLRLLDRLQGVPFREAETPSKTTTAVAFAPDGKALVTASRDGTARIWGVGVPPPFEPVAYHSERVTQATFSSNNQLAIWTWHEGLSLRDRLGMRQTGRWTLASNFRDQVFFAPDGHSLAISNTGGSCHTLSVPAPVRTGVLPVLQRFGDSYGGDLHAVAYTPDGKLILHRQDGGFDLIARDGDREQLPDWGVVAETVRIAASPDGRTVAVLFGRSLRIWNWATRAWRGIGDERMASPCVLVYSPNSRLLAVGHDNGTILVLDAGSQEVLARLYSHTSQITGLAYSVDGRTLASSSLDGTVRLWHVDTWQEMFTLDDRRRRGVYSVAFAPDGETLVTAGDRGEGGCNVKLWFGSREEGPVPGR